MIGIVVEEWEDDGVSIPVSSTEEVPAMDSPDDELRIQILLNTALVPEYRVTNYKQRGNIKYKDE